jgi:dihydroxyacetone kinase DhaKLM complex PTS-EIIA-like component DhaM
VTADTDADDAQSAPQPEPHVGIVLVSHSERLAEGVAELARQLGGDLVPIAAAGGTDDGSLGTSIEKIGSAIRDADAGAGVLLLADLGSAVLTVRALLEDAAELNGAPERADDSGAAARDAASVGSARAVIADAPLVEGAVSAVVTAAAGGDLAAVLASAEEARGFRKL